jgi:hypothetical protein
MKTLTIRRPEGLARRIESEARTRGVSKSDLVQERLEAVALPAAAGLNDILAEAWAANVSARTPRFRPAHKQKLAELIRAEKLRR